MIGVDGDIIVYRMAFACEHTRYIVEQDNTQGRFFPNAKEANAYMKAQKDVATGMVRTSFVEMEPMEHALHSVKVRMQAIQDRYPNQGMVVYFSCSTPDNWRYGFYPEYKANRTRPRPQYYDAVKEYMTQMYMTVTGIHTEADDIIAAEAAHTQALEEEWVTVTIDKDMNQIPGLHYNWVKDEEYYMKPLEAARSVAVQAIAGDNTDNIVGIPGWGDKTAAEWLAQCPHPGIEDIILSAYHQHFKWPEEAAYQAELNTALVTLPTSQREREFLIRGVENARKVLEANPRPSEWPDANGPDATGDQVHTT